MQGTKPQTLGVALNDSPAGLLAWIVEKFRTWSDCGGDPENVFTRDQLITNAMLYWVTQTITSSVRLYWETMHSGVLEEPPEFVGVPTGVALYPKEEVLRFPRSWVEQRYNVTHWAVMPCGGHFAAMEQPALFVDGPAHASSAPCAERQSAGLGCTRSGDLRLHAGTQRRPSRAARRRDGSGRR